MPARLRHLSAAGVALAATALAATALAGAVASPAVAGRQVTVTVVDDAYRPANQRAAVGDTLVWRWATSNRHPHTVTALDGRFDSDRRCGQKPDSCRAAGSVYMLTLRQPGTYRYHCKVHLIMLGSVEVTAATPTEEPTSKPAPPPLPGSSRTAPPPRRSAPPAAARPQTQQPPDPVVAPPVRRYTVGRAGGFRVGYAPAPRPPISPVPVPAIAPPAVAPPAVPESYAPFPSPSPVHRPTALAVDVPTREENPSRGLWSGIAALSVLTSAGAFGKFVLFAEPW